MRRKIVAGNWKMNFTFDEADELLNDIKERIEKLSLDRNSQIVVCPPSPYLEMASDYSSESYFMVGAQDVSDEKKGAFTGEVSAAMLKSMEIDYCIVGHSERRARHNETNQQVARKIDQLLECEIAPIMCCGEQLADREAGRQFDIVGQQIREGLFLLTAKQVVNVVIAYEPVWAIGTGKTATAEQAQEMHAYIRKTLAEQYGETVANEMSILYGGSCKPNNAKELFAQADVDGGLIGGASLIADDFLKIAAAL